MCLLGQTDILNEFPIRDKNNSPPSSQYILVIYALHNEPLPQSKYLLYAFTLNDWTSTVLKKSAASFNLYKALSVFFTEFNEIEIKTIVQNYHIGVPI